MATLLDFKPKIPKMSRDEARILAAASIAAISLYAFVKLYSKQAEPVDEVFIHLRWRKKFSDHPLQQGFSKNVWPPALIA